jgi:hypothetical protein
MYHSEVPWSSPSCIFNHEVSPTWTHKQRNKWRFPLNHIFLMWEFFTSLPYLDVQPRSCKWLATVWATAKNPAIGNMFGADIGFQKFCNHKVSDGTFPNSETPFEGYVIPVFLQAMPPKFGIYIIFLQTRGRRINGTFPPLLMSFSWTSSFRDCIFEMTQSYTGYTPVI